MNLDKLGWRFIPLTGKSPTLQGWNLRRNTLALAPAHGNVGLAHAYSGTCCVDIDDLIRARTWFAGRGVDLDQLLEAADAVQISSGRENRAKLLYRIDQPLRTKFIDDIIELRCADAEGLTMQDVLPPSVHPDTGRPYEWLLGAVAELEDVPQLPAAILEIWQGLLRPSASSSERRGYDRTGLEALLALIDPASLTYQQWVDVGMGLHHELAGDAMGLELWNDWSKRDTDRYKDRRDLAHRYSRFKAGGGTTIATLERLANMPSPSQFEDLGPDLGDSISGDEANAVPERYLDIGWREFANAPSPSWIVKDVLPQAELGVIYGESGSGKSFFALDLMASIARGVTWRDRRVTPEQVMYIAAEGVSGLRRRVRAYTQQWQCELDGLRFITDTPNLLKADWKMLARRFKAAGTRIAVWDTFAQSFSGGDENSGQDMGTALGHLRWLHRETGVMNLLVHHSGKDAARGARGHSSLKAAADFEIEITRIGNVRQARVTKQKDGEDGLTFPFRLMSVPVGVDADGDALTSCYVDHGAQLPAAPEAKREPPKGAKNQWAVWRAIHEVEPDAAGQRGLEAVVAATLRRMEPATEGQRDRRRERVEEALGALEDGHLIRRSEGGITLIDRVEDLIGDGADLA